MYLSRLTLNPRSKQVRTDLANPYEMHSTLCRAFVPPEVKCPAGTFLWRLELTRAQDDPVLLVQSCVEPNWQGIGIQAYFHRAETKPYKLPEQLRVGQVLRFRLEANPTVTRDGKRHGLRKVEEQIEWLSRQASKSGFEIVGAMVGQSERRSFRKRQSEKPITVWIATFDGHLRVTEPKKLHSAVQEGLGHAKALGLGLLSVAGS